MSTLACHLDPRLMEQISGWTARHSEDVSPQLGLQGDLAPKLAHPPDILWHQRASSDLLLPSACYMSCQYVSALSM